MTAEELRRLPEGADLSYIQPDLRVLAVPIAALKPNPTNPRLHPDANRKAVQGSLRKYLQTKSVVANMASGMQIVAGHCLYGEMLSMGAEYIACTIVNYDPVTELGYLLADNRTGDLSEDDPEKLAPALRALLDAGEDVEEIGWDEASVRALLEGAEEAGEDSGGGNIDRPPDSEWAGALGDLPTGEKSPFQQMTFTLHNEQAEAVRAAMELAASMGEYGDLNANSNGNALARVCEKFMEAFDGR
jgi:ParB-like chromosome segregation protein Spo0J